MFWKKPKYEDPVLGVLTYRNSEWISAQVSTQLGPILIGIEGNKKSPDSQGLAIAKATLTSAGPVVESATAFVQSDSHARDFMNGNGSLVLDFFSFTSVEGKFDVGFTLSSWPDAIITVSFENNLPVEVSLAG